MSTRQPENRLLSVIPGLASVEGLALIELESAQFIYEARGAIEHVYFPIDAVISIVADMANGTAIEIATIGCEGMVGIGVALGARESEHRAFVQVPGRAWRLPASRLTELAAAHPDLDDLLQRYVRTLLAQIGQSAACNRAHTIDERTARWLLMTHDRVGRDDFALTQEFLGQMLGAARPRVSSAAGTLQRAGHIRYSRGHITVTDRPGLEGSSCECYRVIADDYDHVMG